MRMYRQIIAAVVVAFISFGAQAQEDDTALKSFYQAPQEVPHPVDNTPSAEKIALGRALYFDPALSISGTVSCSSCHDPRFGFEDGRPRSFGVPLEALPRHSPTTLNLAWSETFFWDGRAGSLEEQALGPIGAGKEMAMPHDMLVERLKSRPNYTEAFLTAFPESGLTIDNVARAIAAFERTLISNNAPFDAWVKGDETAISDAAKRGFRLFNTKARCAECHIGWNFTDDGFHDIGLSDEDMGRYDILAADALRHAFKTPGLRNISERAPYMHDGSLPSLKAVIEHYNNGFTQRESLSPLIQPLGLNDKEVADLIAFLNTLSSPIPDDLLEQAAQAEATAIRTASQAR